MPRRLRSYPNTELKEALMCDIISNSENHYKSSSSSIKLQEPRKLRRETLDMIHSVLWGTTQWRPHN